MLKTEIIFGTNGRVHITSSPKYDYISGKKDDILIYNAIAYMAKYFFNSSFEGYKVLEKTLNSIMVFPTDEIFDSSNFYGFVGYFWTEYMKNLPQKQIDAIGTLMDNGFSPPVILDSNPHNNDGIKVDKSKYIYRFNLNKDGNIKLKMPMFAPIVMIYPLSVIHILSYTLINIDKGSYDRLSDCIRELLIELRTKDYKKLEWLSNVTKRVCSHYGIAF